MNNVDKNVSFLYRLMVQWFLSLMDSDPTDAKDTRQQQLFPNKRSKNNNTKNDNRPSICYISSLHFNPQAHVFKRSHTHTRALQQTSIPAKNRNPIRDRITLQRVSKRAEVGGTRDVIGQRGKMRVRLRWVFTG